jgi:hypothetical protein
VVYFTKNFKKQLTLTVNKGIIRSLDNATGSKKMTKVFIVVQQVAFEGENVVRGFAAYAAAVAFADELAASNTCRSTVFDVRELEVF